MCCFPYVVVGKNPVENSTIHLVWLRKMLSTTCAQTALQLRKNDTSLQSRRVRGSSRIKWNVISAQVEHRSCAGRAKHFSQSDQVIRGALYWILPTNT